MLINLRNALMAGKRLPYDAEVEYLESTGTQWIDNVYTYAGNESSVRFKTGFLVNSVASSSQNVVVGGAGSNQFPRLFRLDSISKIRVSCDSSSSTTISQCKLSTVYDVDATFASDNTARASVNGGVETTFSRAFYAPQDTSCTLFQSFNNDYNLNGRIYYFQLFINGVLVRDFIPVRKGTVGYLYDRVSGKLFGNAGTGDFVLGPDVVPVEYIESHGTEYIDTEYQPTSTTDAAVTFTANQNGNSWVMGATTWWG